MVYLPVPVGTTSLRGLALGPLVCPRNGVGLRTVLIDTIRIKTLCYNFTILEKIKVRGYEEPTMSWIICGWECMGGLLIFAISVQPITISTIYMSSFYPQSIL